MARLKSIGRALPGRLRQRLERLAHTPSRRRLEEVERSTPDATRHLHARSRQRWAHVPPGVGLTWARAVTGDAFVTKVAEHGAFGPGKTVLEVGPGYGRVLEAALRHGVEFAAWIGVDLSEQNVDHLRKSFAHDERLRFLVGDVESIELDDPVDSVISSLTFKHFYPSFEAPLLNLARALRPDGLVAIDLREGKPMRILEEDGETYVRWYERDEVAAIFERCGVRVTAFDTVAHDAEHTRLLVVGRRT